MMNKIGQVVERQLGHSDYKSPKTLESIITFIKGLKLRHSGEGSQSQDQIRMFQRMMLEPYVSLDVSRTPDLSKRPLHPTNALR